MTNQEIIKRIDYAVECLTNLIGVDAGGNGPAIFNIQEATFVLGVLKGQLWGEIESAQASGTEDAKTVQ